MKSAVVLTGVQDMGAFDQHDLAGLAGDDGDGQTGAFRAGKCLREELRGLDVRDDASVAVKVHLYDLCLAGQYDADVSGR